MTNSGPIQSCVAVKSSDEMPFVWTCTRQCDGSNFLTQVKINILLSNRNKSLLKHRLTKKAFDNGVLCRTMAFSLFIHVGGQDDRMLYRLWSILYVLPYKWFAWQHIFDTSICCPRIMTTLKHKGLMTCRGLHNYIKFVDEVLLTCHTDVQGINPKLNTNIIHVTINPFDW